MTRAAWRWFWFDENGAIHFDADKYAKLRGIPLDQAEAEICQMCGELLPQTPITKVPQ